MKKLTESDHLEAVVKLGRRALEGAPLEGLVNDAMAMIASRLDAEFTSLVELLPDGRAKLLGSSGWKANDALMLLQEMDEGTVVGQVIRGLEPVAVAGVHRDERTCTSAVWQINSIASLVCVPLHGPNRPLGVLGAYRTAPRAFTSGETSWLQLVAGIFSSRLQHGFLSQREYDKQLLRAEQMMAIGQVAAGVAHELRNPLTSIKGLVQVNIRDLLARGLPAEDLAIVEHEIRRMERTLQTFLDFARPSEPARRVIELPLLIDRVLALVSGRAKKQDVEIRFARPAEPVEALADQDQIQQLLLNLVLNALDAMPRGGMIVIDLRPPRDGFTECYVRDTGPGIAAHILPKVFETFVSSKETGIGLGLPLSKRIAEDHGGGLSAYNLPAAGACFVLRLPAQ